MIDLSRRAFLSGAFAVGVAAACVPPVEISADAAVPWAADPPVIWRPGSQDVLLWLEEYKARMQTAIEYQYAFHRMEVDTQTVAQTREWLMAAERFEFEWRRLDALRSAVGLAHGQGYLQARDRHDAPFPDLTPSDEGFSWWNGYAVGEVDWARDQSRRLRA